VNFFTDLQEKRSTLRLTYVTLIGVSPLVGLKTEVFIMRQTTLKAGLSKLAKLEKTCFDN
jgi:hypothetical protein